jgi:2-polyprenyl-3-methyl-5-hydroxy-6-metoxy-1,4-benzoquinol methylase
MIHYREKYDSQSSHQQIVRIVKRIQKAPILDVGSAQGMLGQGLLGTGLTIDAIEPDARWAQAAQSFYRTVYNSTIESFCILPSHYRVIVCADVLEHLADPATALLRLRQSAGGDATFIISVPNTAHLSIRLLLLAGFFPRMESGILDKTHLQFFTRKTALAMLSRCGLTVREVHATPVPLEQLPLPQIVNAIGGLLQRVAVRLLPSVFAYQWIFIAEGTDA